MDDDPIDSRYVSWLLQQTSGFELSIRTARSLSEAQEICSNTAFDLYLLDFWMGEESSTALVSMLSQAYQSAKTIVVMSSLDDPSFQELSLQSGADMFLAKQELSKARLEGMLRNVIQVASKRQSTHEQQQLDNEKIASWSRYLNKRLDQTHGYSSLALTALKQDRIDEVERYLGAAVDQMAKLRHEVSYLTLGMSVLNKRSDVNLSPFDIGQLLGDVVQDVRLEAEQFGKQLSVYEQVEDSIILGDAGLIRDLVMILLRGAIRSSVDHDDIAISYELGTDTLEIYFSEFGNSEDQDIVEYQYGASSTGQLAALLGQERTGSFIVADHILQLLGGSWNMGFKNDNLEIVCRIPLYPDQLN